MIDDDMPEWNEDDEYTLLAKMGKKQQASYIRGMAFDVWHYSCPSDGGGPTLSVEEAFTMAEDFVAEAKRRGY